MGLKIVVNTRLLLENRLDGIGWFSFETLKRITRLHPGHEFVFLFDRPWSPAFIFAGNVRAVHLPPPARHPLLWYLWFEWSVKRFLDKEKPDLFLSPDGFIPLTTAAPSLAIIHDINFFHRPKDLPVFTRWYYNYFFPRFARRAAMLGTVSEFSKDDICNRYAIDRSKIEVIYNGANERYAPFTADQIKTTRAMHSSGVPYFIFIGNMHPRKNIPNLLRAYELFRTQFNGEHRLFLVGEQTFLTGEMDRQLQRMKFRNDVMLTGRLEPEHLHPLLASAQALVFIPYIEGFGIPALEAMKCGVPAICSNTASLPEVVGDAALLSNPDDVAATAANMLKLSQSETLWKELSEKGLERAKNFSWDRSAEVLWNLMLKTMKNA
jgi:glycosyltransferase involved in cell wall biosynthesis